MFKASTIDKIVSMNALLLEHSVAKKTTVIQNHIHREEKGSMVTWYWSFVLFIATSTLSITHGYEIVNFFFESLHEYIKKQLSNLQKYEAE